MTTSISPATQKFIKACSNMNIRQLQDAIQEGADINYRDESLDDSSVDDMIYYWDIWDNIDDDGNLIQISEVEMIGEAYIRNLFETKYMLICHLVSLGLRSQVLAAES